MLYNPLKWVKLVIRNHPEKNSFSIKKGGGSEFYACNSMSLKEFEKVES